MSEFFKRIGDFMKRNERFLWIGVVSLLLVFSVFVVVVNSAAAASLNFGFPGMQKFMNVYNSIKSEFVDADKVEDNVLINGAIKGMLQALKDPYTEYLSVEDMSEMNQTSTGTFGGVGMIISEKDDYISVVSPIEDTPAFRKGMKSGDMLISVDGESLRGAKVSEAAKKLKGEPGTTVKVEFMRDSVKYEVELIRAVIDVPTVKYTMIGDLGYLRITQFSGTTDKHVKEALEFIRDKKAKGLIVDLRMNPGGLLGSVIKIVDYFQDTGTIVSTKGRKLSQQDEYTASKFTTIVPQDTPIVVLIDNGSASASEIFSGAIKDLKRGILIGEKSYGKGSVQTIQQLGDDGFKITIAKYYTPSGICIHGIGIMPDIEIKEPELTDDEKDSLRKIYKDKVIDNFIKANPKPTDAQITAFINEKKAKGNNLSDYNMRKLIKGSVTALDSKAPIFDLEYDMQLSKAVDILNKNEVKIKDGKFYYTGAPVKAK